MKLNYLLKLLFLIVFLQSCSKDENSEIATEEVPVEKKITLTSSVAYVTNGHLIGTVQVGDTIVYNYQIVSNVTDGNFYIVPETISAIKHQRQNVDFTLFYNKLKCDTIKCLAKSGKFKVLVNRAGNFQNAVTAINKLKSRPTEVYKSNPVDVLFNSVRIISYYYVWEWDRRGSMVFGYRYYFRHLYKLYIDTGDQQFDNYLTGLDYEMKFHTFIKNYGNFVKSTNINFSEVQETDSGNGPNFVPNIINSIKFKKNINGSDSLIEYTNIPVINCGRQDAWGWDGNNNL